MYLFFAFINRGERKYTWLLILVNTLLIYTHFFGFFVLFIQLCSLFFIRDNRMKLFKGYLLVTLGTLVCFLPWFSIFLSRFWIASLHGTWLSPPGITGLYNMIWSFSNAPVIAVTFLVIMLLGFMNYLFRKKNRNFKRDNVSMLVIWFFVPYLLMFLVSFKVPMFLDRYVVFISPGFYLLVAVSLASMIPSGKWFYAIGLVLVVMMGVTFHPNVDNNRRVREVVSKVKELKTGNSLVYICPEWLDLGFTYYYNNDYFRDYRGYRQKLESENIFPVSDVAKLDTVAINKADKVIYYEEWATLVDKDSLIYKTFAKRLRVRKTYDIFESFHIHVFSEPVQAPHP
jgi:mannosyltransferase